MLLVMVSVLCGVIVLVLISAKLHFLNTKPLQFQQDID